MVVNLNFALATMSMSSEENKSSAIRFGEREVGDSDNRPTKTAAAARHAQFELGDYNDSARDEESDETADVYGSVPSDKRDMMRMGKEQELRVCVFLVAIVLSRTCIDVCAHRESSDRSHSCLLLLS